MKLKDSVIISFLPPKYPAHHTLTTLLALPGAMGPLWGSGSCPEPRDRCIWSPIPTGLSNHGLTLILRNFTALPTFFVATSSRKSVQYLNCVSISTPARLSFLNLCLSVLTCKTKMMIILVPTSQTRGEEGWREWKQRARNSAGHSKCQPLLSALLLSLGTQNTYPFGFLFPAASTVPGKYLGKKSAG